MAFPDCKVLGPDVVEHSFPARDCRDSSKLKGGDEFWGIRNDCNGFFEFYHSKEEAEKAAAEWQAECYVVPVVVFIDTSWYRKE